MPEDALAKKLFLNGYKQKLLMTLTYPHRCLNPVRLTGLNVTYIAIAVLMLPVSISIEHATA